MKSISFNVASVEALENELLEIKATQFNPTLAIVFGSISCDLDQIPTLFNNHKIDVIGCSTAGEISNGEFSDKGISVLLMNLDKSYYKIEAVNNVGQNSLEAGISIGKSAKAFCENPAFLNFCGMTMSADDMIDGIREVVNGKVKLFGAIAGDDFMMEQTWTIINEGCYKDAMVSLIFNQDKVEIGGRAICGWEPIGVENTITKAEGNVIYTINDKPALEVFENYFGILHSNEEEQDTLLVGVAQYPLQITRKGNKILRAALSVNEEEGSLFMAGPVKTGDVFKFSVAPGFEIIEQTIQAFEEYSKSFPEVDAMILLSCKARHMSLGPMVEDEIKGIQNIWKKPLTGFFSYGEVGVSETGECHFYNETCSLILIKEK